ncbi:MAG: WecB/TagA/CpsF family glycosyltransferase [Candidatus Thiodiazotropha taylori]|uniref:WecB/TagA/CpsF family glycosyltransferase n=1 Tax=Candidatus Thiodiazotropha taylori TaxID=2792791 RepID=A0A9E4NGN3_9GAMM|nr:WecB/TagA/CpsF family glycosyltransferase [Candidatus Thiodiazotropha taylori]
MNNQLCYKYILKMRVNGVSLATVIDIIRDWSIHRASRYICVSNVHMCMETFDNEQYREVVNTADLVLADGKPLAIGLKMLGCAENEHLRGADLTRAILKDCDERREVVGLYGATEETMKGIVSLIGNNYPNIKIGCAVSPPFRQLSEEEDNKHVQMINDAHVQVLFVGLGCPKQEKWMAEHQGKVMAVMVGIGAVFDFLGGTKNEAPKWVQQIGLEWLFRLLTEPRRLWKRYAIYNPRFVWHFTKQLMLKR